MSGLPSPLPLGRQRELAVADALADLDAELDQLREALPLVNDPAMRTMADQLAGFVATAEQVLANRADAIDQRLVDALADLLGTLGLVRLPARDKELGFTLGLKEVRGAQGQIALTLTNTLAAAAELGLRASRPALADALAAEVPRALFDDKLTVIAQQLDAVAERLDALDEVQQAAPEAVREARLVAFYLGAMRVEVDLARLSLTMGETTIDFATLARATEAIAGLTGDFLATLRGWAERASAAIRQAAEQVRVPVRLVVTGVRIAARLVASKAAAGLGRMTPEAPAPDPEPAAPDSPPGFSAEAVRDLILAGKEVPAEWIPWVVDLDFSGTKLADLTPLTTLSALRKLEFGWRFDVSNGRFTEPVPVYDLTPLAGLIALQTLNLAGTQVSDLTPLAGLIALQTLNLEGTQVSDLTPLAGLIALQTLSLNRTQVSDLTPLAGLIALQTLYLNGTQVSDLTPLAGLIALQILNLDVTQVSDLTPLAGLIALRTLNLDGTQVSDLTPLAGLIALQRLYLDGTQASDLTPLAGLIALQILNLDGTQVSDLTPLAGLIALRTLNLDGTQVSDLTPLAGLIALQILYLNGTQVSDLTPLAGLIALQRLYLNGTQVSDVSVLRHLRVMVIGGPADMVGSIRATVRRLFGRDRGKTR